MILATVQTYFLLSRGEYDVMICGHVCVFLRMMPFCLCENQSNLVLTYNAPWHVMTDLFASSPSNLRKPRSGFMCLRAACLHGNC